MTIDDRQSELQRLRDQVERLTKINASLMDRVERTVDGSGSAYALFEANVVMQQTIRERTTELARLNESLVEEVNERRRAETLMREARDSAQAANAAKSQFLANMSHEIRTPLTAMIGYAEILREQPNQPETVLEHASTICRNGDHLLSLVNDILDISKLEAGEMTAESHEVEPMAILEEVHSLLKVRSDGKGVQLQIEPRWPLPHRIRTDGTRLRQVLVNLIGNAIKFTEVGSVTVRVSMRTGDDGAAVINFEVIDTGIGISESAIENIFRPFQQADDSMARRFGGTGLGLTISLRLAKLLGGDITATSKVGQGSRFVLTLPIGIADAPLVNASPEARSTQVQATSIDGRLDGIRVLLVEDGPDNQRLINFHLKKAGASAVTAENGLVALEAYADEGPFDLILMDMQMPEMDGYTATGKLREQGCTLPIIALTAHAMAGDRERCIDAGCDEYLTKPIDRAKLIQTARRFLDARDKRSA